LLKVVNLRLIELIDINALLGAAAHILS